MKTIGVSQAMTACMKICTVSALMWFVIIEATDHPDTDPSVEECGEPGTLDVCVQGCNCGCYPQDGDCVTCHQCHYSPLCWNTCRHWLEYESKMKGKNVNLPTLSDLNNTLEQKLETITTSVSTSATAKSLDSSTNQLTIHNNTPVLGAASDAEDTNTLFNSLAIILIASVAGVISLCILLVIVLVLKTKYLNKKTLHTNQEDGALIEQSQQLTGDRETREEETRFINNVTPCDQSVTNEVDGRDDGSLPPDDLRFDFFPSDNTLSSNPSSQSSLDSSAQGIASPVSDGGRVAENSNIPVVTAEHPRTQVSLSSNPRSAVKIPGSYNAHIHNEMYFPSDAEKSTNNHTSGDIQPQAGSRRESRGQLHPNSAIYEQLKKIDWVLGYTSDGDSIRVLADLNKREPQVLQRQLVDATGAEITKFLLSHKDETSC